jgi:hypothetical protein
MLETLAPTFRDSFRGGASYYGVSDIALLADPRARQRQASSITSQFLDWSVWPMVIPWGDRLQSLHSDS